MRQRAFIRHESALSKVPFIELILACFMSELCINPGTDERYQS